MLATALAVAGAGALTLSPASCGGGSGGGAGVPAGSGTVQIPLNANAKGVVLTGGVTRQIQFVQTLPSPGTFTGATLNLQAAAANASLTLSPKPGGVRAAPGDANATLMAWIDEATPEGQARVCGGGIPFGPYQVAWDPVADEGTVDPPTADVTPAALGIINTGTFSMCIEVLPDVNATVDVDRVEISREACEEAPADFGGTWEGTYSCFNDPCADDIDQPISLEVEHDVDSLQRAFYNDGEADYEGTVCGNTFRFNGGDTAGTYTESGVLTLNPDGTATKMSDWQDVFGTCGGHCEDQLTRTATAPPG
jgi:hypothetical protein